MKEDMNNILKIFNKIMENYEIDKKIGQMSVDSICHLFPSQITTIMNYIKYLESNWKELKKSIEYKLRLAEEDDVDDEELKGYLIQRRDTFKEILNVMQELENKNVE